MFVLVGPFSNGRSKHVYAVKRVQLSEGAWAVSSVGFTESAYCVSRCFHSLAIVKLCSVLLTAPPSFIKVCDEVMLVEEFQIVMKSLTHFCFFILNCVYGNVYV